MGIIFESLGWALLHSIWQSITALALVFLIHKCAKRYSSSMRYSAYMITLISAFIVFLTTFSMKLRHVADANQNINSDVLSTFSTPTFADVINFSRDQFLSTGSTLDLPMETSIYIPMLAILWCFGFLFQSFRYALSFIFTQRLRHNGITLPPSNWTRKFSVMAANSGVRENVKLYISCHIDNPMTMGFLKPIVLVPLGFLTQLPQDQVEAILLHEIAHIRRFDYVFNLLQIAIKSVFFFNPAIYFISRLIDIEREQACDDLAVAQGRNPYALAKGLASLQLNRRSRNNLTMAIHGKEMVVLNRLKRLTQPIEHKQRPEQLMLSILTAFIMGGIYFGTAQANNGLQELDQKREYKKEVASVKIASRKENNAAKKPYDKNMQHENVRQALYNQLMKDGLISSLQTTVILKPKGKSWVANDVDVPKLSQERYCDLISQLKLKKSTLEKIKLSPKSVYAFTKNQEVTYGQFTSSSNNHRSVTKKKSQRVELVKRDEHSSKFRLPLDKADVTANFGQTGKLWPKTHLGVDFRGQIGDPIYASSDGKVLLARAEGHYGKRVVIQHKDGIITTYSHMNSISVSARDTVKAGNIIGTVGSTGKSTGPHLHFELIKKGRKINPEPYIFKAKG